MKKTLNYTSFLIYLYFINQIFLNQLNQSLKNFKSNIHNSILLTSTKINKTEKFTKYFSSQTNNSIMPCIFSLFIMHHIETENVLF
jgi:hypothetical protein